MPHSLGSGRKLSRRSFIGRAAGATAVALAAPAIVGRGARAAETLVVRDAGGVWQTAATEAFYKPFAKETGIEIVPASAGTDPLAQIKAMVDAKSYNWDVSLNRVGGAELIGNQGYMEEIDWSGIPEDALIPRARSKYLLGTDVFATVFGYRTDTVKGAPESWADFWDVKKFPGRRAMSKHAIDTLEEALLADGVEPAKLYPLDIPRALKKLDQLKQSISVWWTGGAQASQLLKSGEIDLLASWNARIQAPIDDGAPAKLVWNQGLYGVEGFSILKGGPKVAAAQKFVKYCADAKRQAEFAKIISYGPTNQKAFEFLPAERAALLPTAPKNFSHMIYQDHNYWAANQEKALDQFNAWLLS